MYSINVTTPHSLKSLTIGVESTLFAAMENLENYVWSYLTLKGGEESANAMLQQEPSSNLSRRWNSFPQGYFKTRNTKTSLHKQTIWKKIIKRGFLWNTYEIERIFDIDIVYSNWNLNKLDTQAKCKFSEFEIDDLIFHQKLNAENLDQILKRKQSLELIY